MPLIGVLRVRHVANANIQRHTKKMNTQVSPYNRQCIWLMREISIIALFTLAAWAVAAPGLDGILQMLILVSFVGIILALAGRMVADIIVAGSCQWLKAMGRGLGSLAVSIRYAWRGR